MTTPLYPKYRNLKVGQRVLARFDRGERREGVVSGEPSYHQYPVQFEPCGAHYHCAEVSPFGDDGGWTEQEYRIERERANSWDRARNVEAERIERYPDAPFSPAFQEVTI